MRLRSFLYLLGVVALVAVIYSPSVIGVGAGNSFETTSPSNTTDLGTSKFLDFLKSSGYHVLLINDSQSELSQIARSNWAVFFLIGADEPLSPSELQLIQSRYNAGTLSLLVSEGNKTNALLISAIFNGDVSGAASLLRWRSRVSSLTHRAERFLNEIGMTIAGEEDSKEQVEYAIGRR